MDLITDAVNAFNVKEVKTDFWAMYNNSLQLIQRKDNCILEGVSKQFPPSLENSHHLGLIGVLLSFGALAYYGSKNKASSSCAIGYYAASLIMNAVMFIHFLDGWTDVDEHSFLRSVQHIFGLFFVLNAARKVGNGSVLGFLFAFFGVLAMVAFHRMSSIEEDKEERLLYFMIASASFIPTILYLLSMNGTKNKGYSSFMLYLIVVCMSCPFIHFLGTDGTNKFDYKTEVFAYNVFNFLLVFGSSILIAKVQIAAPVSSSKKTN